MKSKVKTVEFTKEWSGDKGTVYYHNILFENGDIGSIGCKEKLPTKIAVGTELDYEITKDAKGNNKVVINTQTVPYPSKGGFVKPDPKTQMVSYAASYTKDLVIGGAINIDQFSQYADKIYDWMSNKLI